MALKIVSTGAAVTVLDESGRDITTDLYARELRVVYSNGPEMPRLEVDILCHVEMDAGSVRAFTQVPGSGKHKEIRRIEFADGTTAEYPSAWFDLLPEESEKLGGEASPDGAARTLEGGRDG